MNADRQELVKPWLAIVLSIDLLLPKFYWLIDPVDFTFSLYLGFLAAQVTLHAGWTVFGPGNLLFRIASVLPALLVVQWYLHGINHEGVRLELQLAFATQWWIVTVANLFLIGLGYRLMSIHDDLHERFITNRQYAMRHLVALLTVASVLFATAARVEDLWLRLSDPLCWLLAVVTASVSIPTVPSVLIAKRVFAPVCLALTVPCFLAFMVLYYFGPGGATMSLPFFTMASGLPIIVLATLRRGGYRLCRVSTSSSAAANYHAEYPADSPV